MSVIGVAEAQRQGLPLARPSTCPSCGSTVGPATGYVCRCDGKGDPRHCPVCPSDGPTPIGRRGSICPHLIATTDADALERLRLVAPALVQAPAGEALRVLTAQAGDWDGFSIGPLQRAMQRFTFVDPDVDGWKSSVYGFGYSESLLNVAPGTSPPWDVPAGVLWGVLGRVGAPIVRVGDSEACALYAPDPDRVRRELPAAIEGLRGALDEASGEIGEVSCSYCRCRVDLGDTCAHVVASWDDDLGFDFHLPSADVPFPEPPEDRDGRVADPSSWPEAQRRKALGDLLPLANELDRESFCDGGGWSEQTLLGVLIHHLTAPVGRRFWGQERTSLCVYEAEDPRLVHDEIRDLAARLAAGYARLFRLPRTAGASGGRGGRGRGRAGRGTS